MKKILDKNLLKTLCAILFAFCLCTAGTLGSITAAATGDTVSTAACKEADCSGEYVNGICSTDGRHYQAPKLNEKDYDLNGDATVDEVYEIENAGQLFWFGKLVNDGTYDANAMLKADIDMGGSDWKPMGQTALYYDSQYGDERYHDTGYRGIFDGNYHTISNFSVSLLEGEHTSYGLVGTLSGTVKNLGIEEFVFSYSMVDTMTTDMRTGVIVGQILVGGKVENCFVKGAFIDIGAWVAGGIAGCNYNGTIENCFVVESTVAGSDTRYGYIVGDNRADGGATDRNGKVVNCYADTSPVISAKTMTRNETGASVKSESAFADGEIAYRLGAAWGQKIGVDSYPLFGGDKVYSYTLCNGVIRYTNEAHENEQCIDANTDNICDTCGYHENDDIYYISKPNHLYYLGELINTGVNTDATAKLVSDIDFAGYDKTITIGTAIYAYGGTFDGQNYTIKNYSPTFTQTGTYGLFNYLSGATVKNFSINGEVTINCMKKICFGAIGASGVGSTISNIHSSLNVMLTSGQNNQIGGIVAIVGNGTKVDKCSYNGTLDMGKRDVDAVGGIVGYVNDEQTSYITNCAFYGTIKSTHTVSDQIGGILGFYRGDKLYLQNCLSVGAIDTVDSTKNGSIIGILRLHSGANTMVINNYYLEGKQPFGDYNPGSTNDDSIFDGYKWQTMAGSSTAVTAAELANGKVTYRLNVGVTNGTQAWYQTLSENDYPTFSGGTVYASSPCKMYYYNTEPTESISHTGGTANCKNLAICSACGEKYGTFGDHEMSTEWTTKYGQHYHKCTVKGCDYTEDKENCSAGTTKGTCGVCGASMSGSSSGSKPNSNPNTNPTEDNEGLPIGAIVGIVVGSVAIVGGGGFAIFWFVIKKKSRADQIESSEK